MVTTGAPPIDRATGPELVVIDGAGFAVFAPIERPAAAWEPAPVEAPVPVPVAAPSSRDFSLDLLRAIAIIQVVLAHSHTPGWLFQLRNFDVPLLMMLSGWSISLSMAHRRIDVRSYLRRRAERLLAPTWTFLALFFCGYAVADGLGLGNRHYGAKVVVASLALLGNAGGPGIGYIWIIRVNLLNSLATPFLLRINKTCKNDALFIAACMTTIVMDSVLWVVFTRSGAHAALGVGGDAIEQTVFYLFGYGPVFALGIRLCRMPRRTVLNLAAVALAVFAFLAVCFYARGGAIARTEVFKYPPQLYFLAYGGALSLILIAYRDRLASFIPEGLCRRVIGFIGGNTLWIYLWHILGLLWVADAESAGLLPANWAVSWLCVATTAILLTWLQKTAASAAAQRLPPRGARTVTMLLG